MVKQADYTKYLRIVVSIDEPKRTRVIKKLISKCPDKSIKANLEVLLKRYEKTLLKIDGFQPIEIEHYRSIFLKYHWFILHLDDFLDYIQEQLRELDFLCRRIEKEIEIHRNDEDWDIPSLIEDLTENKRLKVYLESLFDVFNSSDGHSNNVTTLPKKPTIGDDLKAAKEIIKPLSGHWNRERIMRPEEYDLFSSYIKSIVRSEELPNELEKFHHTKVSNEFISKTVHNVYVHVGKKHRDEFIKLIQLFSQFDNYESKTISKKFSNYRGSYEKDIKNMITY